MLIEYGASFLFVSEAAPLSYFVPQPQSNPNPNPTPISRRAQ
ncbi:hypothetical protein CBM2587_B90043 [Cupriavidus taiwanensis]|uniref:Uncharacterized protein n=1 Tax=Cupriavidus taiwanensis TaxID=164546 RepID=A0A976A8E6_9BURK|nr:hypothetical protein CBM2587_B90043 [Cupriavidus taiwanensis]